MILTVLAGLLVSAVAPSAKATPSPACAAAERLIDEIWTAAPSSPPITVIGERRFRSPAWKRPRELSQGGWSGPAPSIRLLDLWERDAGSTATRCVNVRARAEAAAILLAPGAEPDAERTSIGLPVVDKGGTTALVQVVTHRRSLGGGAYLYLLRRSGGRWAVVSKRMLAIS